MQAPILAAVVLGKRTFVAPSRHSQEPFLVAGTVPEPTHLLTGPDHWDRPDLSDHVVLVAGATRGAGRAIAVAFGQCGATVHVTGRSTEADAATHLRPETIEAAARRVTAAGGTGVAHVVDHLDADAVASLMASIEARDGRLHVLVNCLWGGDPLVEWGKPVWEHDLAKGLRVLNGTLRSHITTAHHATPLLLRSKGVVVEVTDGTDDSNREYRGNLYYDLVKTATSRLAFALDAELRSHGALAVAVTPGFLRSEAMLDHFGVTEQTWRDGVAADPFFAASETPAYVARAIVSLCTDPDRSRYAGTTTASWRLARTYGFTDVDGRRPYWEEDLLRIQALQG